MECLRTILLYLILVPMPSVSPVFLLIFIIAAYRTIRPCGYCLATLMILFFSTSPSSPFLMAFGPASKQTEPSAQPIRLTDPIPNRGAFYLNRGMLFEPTLNGYHELQRAWAGSEVQGGAGSSNQTGEGSAVETAGPDIVGTEAQTTSDHSLDTGGDPDTDTARPAPAHPEEQKTEDNTPPRVRKSWWPGYSTLRPQSNPPINPGESSPSTSGAEPESARPAEEGDSDELSSSRPLPKGYLDLRYRGIGVVVDLGWRRTDEGLQWEIDDVRHAVAKSRKRALERGGGWLWGWGGSGGKAKANTNDVVAAGPGPGTGVGEDTAEPASSSTAGQGPVGNARDKRWWLRAPLVGAW